MDNIIDIELTGRSTRREQKLWQYDYGQMLRIAGKEFQKVTEVQFSLQQSGGHTLDRIGTSNNGLLTVQIPNELLQNKGTTSDYTIYAFVYLSGDGSGNTKYMIQLPVESRPEPTDPSEDPSIDPSIFKDAINSVNASAERAEAAEKSAKESANKAKEYADSAGKSKGDVEKARDNAISAIGIEKESALRGIESKTVESLQKIQSQTEESQNSIKQSIADATKKKTELDSAISNATDAKGNLDKAVQSAGNAKTELDTSVGKSGEAKTALDSSISSAGEKQLALDATVEQANAVDASLKEQIGSAEQIQANVEQIAKNKADISSLNEDLDNKIEHVGGYKEYDIGTPSVGTYWNKNAKKQLKSETYQSFNPISLKAGTYHYENMSGSFTFYEDTDGNWIPIGKYSTSGNGNVVITNDTTMYITEMQKSGVFVGAKLYSGDITQKESNWFKNPKYDIDNINNTLESLSDSVNDIKSIDGSVIKEYCIYVSTTGSDTSGDGSEEKPFATIYHANETITDNSYAKRYRIIVLPGTYTDLQDKYTGIAQTSKYQGVITKPWVTYESKSGNPEDTIIEWNGSTGLENPIRSDIVEKCAFHIVSLPRTFTAIKGFTIKSKNTRYAMHCESSGMGIQGEWLIENCIFDWGGCPNISDDTGRFPAIGIGMSPCEKGTIKFCKIVTTTVETMLVHDGKNKDGNSAVILGAELNFIKCDLGTGRLQFQSIYPKSGEINAKTNNVCNLISCTQINNLYSYISSLNSDDEMVWRVYGKDCDFASYGNMSDYVYKIGTANNVSN